MTPRAVFDTSTLVSAALKRNGIPRQALDHAFEFWELCASLDTSSEIEEVLLRSKFDRLRPREDREDFLALLRHSIHLISVTPAQMEHTHPRCRDPKDDAFLALALAANAGVIVSSDADLLVLHPWNGIAILTPSQFLARDLPASI